MVHTDGVVWRKVMVTVLAGLAALGEVNASTSTISGGLWLSLFVACSSAAAGLALPLLKKLSQDFLVHPYG
ncbi:hypothetical protein [Rhizocola hellebori]|uniref:hypothetical protein n=1 Tax=Rhizocola hellebori TaxID=1392758 RepID=UPI001943A9C5|nr:hypothetical protein [Rhizocola hellebori]